MMEQQQEAPQEEGMPLDEAEPIQAMEKAIPREKRKFKGRTGGITPDWRDKAPNEERDVDEWAQARANKNELTLSKSWLESLSEKGFHSPLIKEVTPDMKQMWFSENNVDYVAELSSSGVTNIEKAIFGDATRFSRNKQEKRKATKPTENVINLSDDAE
jgi:hypothetical protein